MIELATVIWAHKGVIGTVICGIWFPVAQTMPELAPAGGQLTLNAALVLAIVFLVKEIKAERKAADKARKETCTAHKETIKIMTDQQADHREKMEELIDLLKDKD